MTLNVLLRSGLGVGRFGGLVVRNWFPSVKHAEVTWQTDYPLLGRIWTSVVVSPGSDATDHGRYGPIIDRNVKWNAWTGRVRSTTNPFMGRAPYAEVVPHEDGTVAWLAVDIRAWLAVDRTRIAECFERWWETG